MPRNDAISTVLVKKVRKTTVLPNQRMQASSKNSTSRLTRNRFGGGAVYRAGGSVSAHQSASPAWNRVWSKCRGSRSVMIGPMKPQPTGAANRGPPCVPSIPGLPAPSAPVVSTR